MSNVLTIDRPTSQAQRLDALCLLAFVQLATLSWLVTAKSGPQVPCGEVPDRLVAHAIRAAYINLAELSPVLELVTAMSQAASLMSVSLEGHERVAVEGALERIGQSWPWDRSEPVDYPKQIAAFGISDASVAADMLRASTGSGGAANWVEFLLQGGDLYRLPGENGPYRLALLRTLHTHFAARATPARAMVPTGRMPRFVRQVSPYSVL